MATILQQYTELRAQINAEITQGGAKANAVWTLGEVLYRISVLETIRMYADTAPKTTNMQALQTHYQMLDAYVQGLARERRYGPSRGPDTDRERAAAQNNLERVIQDYRKRFSSFAPVDQDSYSCAIQRLAGTLLPAWLQFRDSFVPIKRKESSAA